MGTDVFALVTRWEPIVAAFRTAGGMDFYWDMVQAENDAYETARRAGKPTASDGVLDRLPYATERWFAGGWGFLVAGWCYDALRAHLPTHVRDPADAFVRMLYPEDRIASDDLSSDSKAAHDGAVWCAMRPTTVRDALQRAESVPWAELAEIGDRIVPSEMAGDSYIPDYEAFELALDQQREWLREAARTGCGLVVVISA